MSDKERPQSLSDLHPEDQAALKYIRRQFYIDADF